ncbi:MAG: SHOCT domain-containing protein [Rhodospirillales bacterium]|nr:SHOCT domain-containing protein [Rhodospirillales bacterium]
MIAPSLVRAGQQRGDYGPHMMWDGGWYGMILGPIMMLLFIAAVVVLVVFLVRWLGGTSQSQGGSSSSGRSAVDILKERFARGEIDKEDYEERRRFLEK